MQCSLFGGGPARFDAAFGGGQRVQLAGGAWIEHHPGWLEGHARVFEQLLSQAAWHSMRRQMYDREVEVPRLLAQAPESGPMAELLQALSQTLSRRYGWPLSRVSLAHYRDGRDSVAFHGDKVGSLANDCVVATVSVGAPRRFLLAPLHDRAPAAQCHLAPAAQCDLAAAAQCDLAAAAQCDLAAAALCHLAPAAQCDLAAAALHDRAPAAQCDLAAAGSQRSERGHGAGTGQASNDNDRATLAFDLGWGDLFVMGGSCQRTWQHAVPKRAHADPRISIMFRPPIPERS